MKLMLILFALLKLFSASVQCDIMFIYYINRFNNIQQEESRIYKLHSGCHLLVRNYYIHILSINHLDKDTSEQNQQPAAFIWQEGFQSNPVGPLQDDHCVS